TRNGGELDARAEAAIVIPKLDDLLRRALLDPGNIPQQRPGSRVEIHTDSIDAAFNCGFERVLQLPLIDIVLILTDADGLGVDLNQFGQRVLETASDGDGAPHGEVQVGELLP